MTSEVKVPKICFGTWGMGDWGRRSQEYDQRLVLDAYNKGLIFFDTAPSYGNGYSEAILGVLPIDALIATKVPAMKRDGCLDEAYDCSWMDEVVQKSKERLRRDEIYLLQLHNWNYEWKVDGNFLNNMMKLKSEHGIRLLGISLPKEPPSDPSLAQVLFDNDVFDSYQIYWNLADPRNAPLIKMAKNRGRTVLLRSLFKQGTLFRKAQPGKRKGRFLKIDNTRSPNLINVNSLNLKNPELYRRSLIESIDLGADSVIIGIRTFKQLNDAEKYLRRGG